MTELATLPLPAALTFNPSHDMCVCEDLCRCDKYLTPGQDTVILIQERILHEEAEIAQLTSEKRLPRRVAALRTSVRRSRLSVVYLTTLAAMRAEDEED